MNDIVFAACGTGQQGCTFAVSAEGELSAFGSNFGGRLGLGGVREVRAPTRVATGSLAGKKVVAVACGLSHGVAICTDWTVHTWGTDRHGCLGRRVAGRGAAPQPPGVVPLPPEATAGLPALLIGKARPRCLVDADNDATAVVVGGRLFVWGANEYGRLGLGHHHDVDNGPIELVLPSAIATVAAVPPPPAAVAAAAAGGGGGGAAGAPLSVARVSLGSLYTGIVTTTGRLFVCGCGAWGNLGLGSRRRRQVTPAEVTFAPSTKPRPFVVDVACTRGQEGVKGGLGAAKKGGSEGPHTVIVTRSGDVYTCGTCHKGLLGNLGSKTGAFNQLTWDELSPYRVGGPLRNDTASPPLSPFAAWPAPYDRHIGQAREACSAHIHAAVLGADGRAWAWGCASNDGRCGVERFLNMKGEGKPPEVDRMKAYLMQYHRIGLARHKYWPFNSGLRGVRVLQLASGRNHMAAIGVPDGGVDARPVADH